MANRKGDRGSFPSEKGREKTDKGWHNSPKEDIGFGLEPDPFKTALDRYGVWPVTVWDCDFGDSMLKRLKTEIGDGSWQGGSTRAKSFHSFDIDKIRKRTHMYNEISESVFNPIVAIWILNLFAPQTGIVYDPFAGGGCRAIISAKKGLKYIGIELRQKEVDAVKARLKSNNVTAKIICGDSRNVPQIPNESADFLITCPPYYNMEKYDGGPNDISMANTYDEFLDKIEASIKESHRILRPGSLSCWVVGLHRNKNGELLTIPHDIVKIHKRHGYKHKEEIVLNWNKNTTGALRRVGNFEKGNKFLIRNHEYLEVFESQQGHKEIHDGKKT